VAQVLGFVARRLAAEPVALIFATRVPGEELAGLPELPIAGLRKEDVRALLELPRGLSQAELAGGFGLPGAISLPGRIEESFRRQLDALPPRRDGCCCWQQPIRPGTPCWCGGRPVG
jgi:hypothetical protein